MAEVLEITDNNFETEIIQNERPALVDFWAAWCGPCRMISPVVEELAVEYGDRINFFKCDVDANPVTPSRYSIRSIPTLIIFRGGKVVEQIIGAVPRDNVEAALKKVL
ncbi:MAG: thioredoxin [Deltaproteobacteria bacterium]|jgi:thioredoxin 1|nr:thioredoxin [Deltaproteobacteria bacterium]MDL1977468.1 thioredoxin [Deltaproteobacteria bacterium]